MKIMRLVALTTVFSMVHVAAAQAAPVGTLKQYRVPTANSQPRSIASGSDGNFWFTESSEFLPAAIGRITPAGAVTEFPVGCGGCILTDIVQGPGGILYYTSNNAELGRITAAGVVLAPIPMPNSSVLAGNLASDGTSIWITDFNNNVVWRYRIAGGTFTQYTPPTAGSVPFDVAVDSVGTVWFTEFGNNAIARLNPVSGAITEIPTTSPPRGIIVAEDGQIWFTSRFATPPAVGRLNPATNTVVEFAVGDGGPEGIAASLDGSVWFTLNAKGSVARITNSGVITEGKVVKGSDPFGIAVDSQGDPWYTMMAANKIAEFQLR
ncbi:MAG: virginiamycin lyase [Ilumatobacteraceae bacterium]|jgi:virginiamycin B lyase